MENNLSLAYSEVNKILSYMDEKEVEKIPNKLRNAIEKGKIKNYEPDINPEIPLEQQNLQRKTIIILAILNLNYWCKSEEEKKELVKRYFEYDKKIEEEIKEKYNPDNIFKVKEEKREKEVALIQYEKTSFIRKIFNKIAQFFKKIS